MERKACPAGEKGFPKRLQSGGREEFFRRLKKSPDGSPGEKLEKLRKCGKPVGGSGQGRKDRARCAILRSTFLQIDVAAHGRQDWTGGKKDLPVNGRPETDKDPVRPFRNG